MTVKRQIEALEREIAHLQARLRGDTEYGIPSHIQRVRILDRLHSAESKLSALMAEKGDQHG